jgi:peptidoglycan/LPS O-acetylase OafA/YrhL
MLERPTSHFVVLDGLRGIAALGVVALHIGVYFRTSDVPTHAHLAVDFLFLPSVFVVAHACDDKLAQGIGPATSLEIRLSRLYPLIVLGISLGLLNQLAGWGMYLPFVIAFAVVSATCYDKPVRLFLVLHA